MRQAKEEERVTSLGFSIAASIDPNPAACRLWGTKKAPTTKVSESLDYETPQNRLYYERLDQRKGKKGVFG